MATPGSLVKRTTVFGSKVFPCGEVKQLTLATVEGTLSISKGLSNPISVGVQPLEEENAHVKVPQGIRSVFLADEHVLLAVKQSRWKVVFTPDTIVVTDRRVIRYSPSGFLGFRKDIEDYRYEDMANFKVSKEEEHADTQLN